MVSEEEVLEAFYYLDANKASIDSVLSNFSGLESKDYKLGSKKVSLGYILDNKYPIEELSSKLATFEKDLKSQGLAGKALKAILLLKENYGILLDAKIASVVTAHHAAAASVGKQETEMVGGISSIKYDDLRYSLEVTMVGFLTCLDNHKGMRVASIIKTRTGKEYRSFNDYNNPLGHAEVEGIVQVEKAGHFVVGGSMYVTDECCYFEDEYEISYSGKDIIETIVWTSDDRGDALKPGDRLVRTVLSEKKEGNRRYIEESCNNPKFGEYRQEVIVDDLGKGAYLYSYMYKGVEVPREYVEIRQENGKTVATRCRGCAVTLAFKRISEVLFVVPRDMYNQGRKCKGGGEFLRWWGASARRIDHPRLNKVCEIIKDEQTVLKPSVSSLKPEEQEKKVLASAMKFREALQNIIEIDRIFGFAVISGYERMDRLFSELKGYRIELQPENKESDIEKRLRKQLSDAIRQKDELTKAAIRNVLNRIQYSELQKIEDQIGVIHIGRIETEVKKVVRKLLDEQILDIISDIVKENEKIIAGEEYKILLTELNRRLEAAKKSGDKLAEEEVGTEMRRVSAQKDSRHELAALLNKYQSDISKLSESYGSASPQERELLEKEIGFMEDRMRFGEQALKSGKASTYLLPIIHENIVLKKYLPEKMSKAETREICVTEIAANPALAKKGPGQFTGILLKKYGKDKLEGFVLREVLTELLAASL